MNQQLALSLAELELILEVLERSQKELLIEIRHSDTGTFRAALRDRLATLESLLQRVRELAARKTVPGES
ncbi:MAG: hypothetical protein HYZ57_20730 [Acidobacteria bacterium]|nr:hypothetical protein [Acidobacteriota bacterium]